MTKNLIYFITFVVSIIFGRAEMPCFAATGIFYARALYAVPHPRECVVMAYSPPLKVVDSGKGGAAPFAAYNIISNCHVDTKFERGNLGPNGGPVATNHGNFRPVQTEILFPSQQGNGLVPLQQQSIRQQRSLLYRGCTGPGPKVKSRLATAFELKFTSVLQSPFTCHGM